MKKSILVTVLLIIFSGYSQVKTISFTAEDVAYIKPNYSINLVEEKIVNIPIYKDTLVETQKHKELVHVLQGYRNDYDPWLKDKNTNEEYNKDIATIINNLESYINSKENYEITKPLIDEAQKLISKNKIYYHDNYGRTNGELIILSLNGKKPQKTKTFFDDSNYKTPIERCLEYCKTIKKLEEPLKNQNVISYQEIEKQLKIAPQFKTTRLPSNMTTSKKCLVLNKSVTPLESEFTGVFNVSKVQYVILSESEDYADNEIIEATLLNPNINKLKTNGSEIFTNSVTGKMYLSDNRELIANIESQRKLIKSQNKLEVEKQQAQQQISKYGTVYYDKEKESNMLKIQTGTLKLSNYNPQDIPQFVSIYNSLYGKLNDLVKQMPAHITILKKYYTLHNIQGRNMSKANINAWSQAINAATPIRKAMQTIVMNEHFDDASFFPNTKYEVIQEDFDLYYNASLSILGL